MDERDEHLLQTATDRFERRLAEEAGKLRSEVAGLRGDLAGIRGDLRAEIVERNHELLKWALVLWVALIPAMAALMAYYG